MKSMMGYAVAAVAAYALWLGITKILDEDKPVKEEHKKYWAYWTVVHYRFPLVDLVIT